MAPIPCPAGDQCEYKTPALEFDDAMKLLYMHERHAREYIAAQQTTGGKKVEKFPRSVVGIDETSEKWQDFKAAWKKYKDEYSLQGHGITKQLYACCSSELATSLSTVQGHRGM